MTEYARTAETVEMIVRKDGRYIRILDLLPLFPETPGATVKTADIRMILIEFAAGMHDRG
jgi:hypothetical protein